MQPRILYPAKLSFRIEGEIKGFPDKQKLKKDFVTTKPTLQEILRGTLWGEKKKKKRKEDQSNKDYKGPKDITRNTNSIGVTQWH